MVFDFCKGIVSLILNQSKIAYKKILHTKIKIAYKKILHTKMNFEKVRNLAEFFAEKIRRQSRSLLNFLLM